MTRINISIKHATASGAQPVDKGVIRFIPYRHVAADKSIIVREPFGVELDGQGKASVDLLPTLGRFLWHIVEFGGTSLAHDRWVEVPDSKEAIDYADLEDMDPRTGVPKALRDSQLLEVMHADDMAMAEQLSAKWPDRVILFDEENTTVKAQAAMAALANLTAEAQTNATYTRAALLSAQQSANTILGLRDEASDASGILTSTTGEVAARGATAIADIDSTVQAVRDRAEAATSELPSSTTGAKDPESTEETSGEASDEAAAETVAEKPAAKAVKAKAKKATVKEA